MKTMLLAVLAVLVSAVPPRLSAAESSSTPAASPAVRLSAIPPESLAKKKELLFADDFQGATPDKAWHKVVPTFVV